MMERLPKVEQRKASDCPRTWMRAQAILQKDTIMMANKRMMQVSATLLQVDCNRKMAAPRSRQKMNRTIKRLWVHPTLENLKELVRTRINKANPMQTTRMIEKKDKARRATTWRRKREQHRTSVRKSKASGKKPEKVHRRTWPSNERAQQAEIRAKKDKMAQGP